MLWDTSMYVARVAKTNKRVTQHKIYSVYKVPPNTLVIADDNNDYLILPKNPLTWRILTAKQCKEYTLTLLITGEHT